MRIWIINYYAGTPDTAGNPRYLKLARHFMDAGHEVITFNAGRTAKINDSEFEGGNFIVRQYDGFHFVHVRVPAFEGNGVKRMFSIWKFAQIIRMGHKQFVRPDVILQNIHPPFDYPIVNLAKKLKCKYIAEAWDLWPEDFVTFGLVSAKNPAMKVAYAIEKRYYYAADDIIFTFLGAFDYLKRQGWMKEQGGKIDPTHLHYINNGIDLEEFDRNKMAYPRADADMNDPKLVKIVYLGSINRANNVKTLIDAAAQMQDMPNYRFFIYGNGAYRQELMEYVKTQGINNVVFKEEHIPLEECAWVVSQATVNVMNYDKDFGKWGVSSGKMFQYLAAGKPIVCNINIAYDNVIKDNRLGVSCDLATPEQFVEAIREVAEQPRASYDAMCERVREVARRFDYNVLAQRELELIES
ncbi:MAG: glycosyltransferase family 4 protein [Bacteroidales bacterium]|nr:glycosyltransferase family 4 protein [Bacteroidales bacterium]